MKVDLRKGRLEVLQQGFIVGQPEIRVNTTLKQDSCAAQSYRFRYLCGDLGKGEDVSIGVLDRAVDPGPDLVLDPPVGT